jgi:hypothetical protein
VLHLRHKLKYFEKAGWHADWIKSAEEIVRAEFDRSYATLPLEAENIEVPPLDTKKPKVRDMLIFLMDAPNFFLQARNIFDDLPALTAPKTTELRDELARYLSTDPELVKDVLLWWHEHKATYPRLSQMALDYLTIPGESYYYYIRLSLNVPGL